MLYGTRKELNKKLKRMFASEERFALLVWTADEVRADIHGMTDPEAAEILEVIGRSGSGEHCEEGISFRTVRALYAGIRENTPHVSVPADTLARITDIAARALSEEDAQAWPLASLHYPCIADAQADIAWLKRELAA